MIYTLWFDQFSLQTKGSVVFKMKTPKTKTRRPKTHENEDSLRKTKTPYENKDFYFFIGNEIIL